jgi:hypothetical protein
MDQEVVIIGGDGKEHVFPAGFDPKKAAGIVRQSAPQAKAKPQGNLGRFAGVKMLGDAVMGAGKAALDHPVQTGAMLGGLAAAPFTGGASLLAAGAGAAGGAGIGSIVNAARGGENGPSSALGVLKTMAGQGAAGLAGQGIGSGIAKGAQLAGRGLYRAGLLPIQQVLGKYGDIVKTGVEEAIPVSKGGAQKIANVRAGRTAAKKDALNLADENVTFRAKGITDDAMSQLDDKATSLDIAGEGDPSPVFQKRMDTFAAKNPDGTLTPSRLERIKSTLDDRNGAAYMKARKREPLTPKEESRLALTQAAGRAQETAVPGYRDMNKGIMDAVGLEKAIQRRTSGTGGNQGLENAMTMLGGASAIPARLLMLPPVLSGAGIGLYQAGKHIAKPAEGALRALLAALSGSGQEE